jgi:hypothetical protein
MIPKLDNFPPDAPAPLCDTPRVDRPESQEAERRRRANLRDQSWAAFQRDFAELAKEHYQQWVAYHGDQQLGISCSKTELYQKCLRRGLERGEFQVFGIEHPLPDNLFVDWPVLDS